MLGHLGSDRGEHVALEKRGVQRLSDNPPRLPLHPLPPLPPLSLSPLTRPADESLCEPFQDEGRVSPHVCVRDGEVVLASAGEKLFGYAIIEVDEDRGVRIRDRSGETFTLIPP